MPLPSMKALSSNSFASISEETLASDEPRRPLLVELVFATVRLPTPLLLLDDVSTLKILFFLVLTGVLDGEDTDVVPLVVPAVLLLEPVERGVLDPLWTFSPMIPRQCTDGCTHPILSQYCLCRYKGYVSNCKEVDSTLVQ